VYNQKLASAILHKLVIEFPNKVQMNDLRQDLSEFSNAHEKEWLVATDALMKLGHAKGRVLPSGMGEIPAAIGNIEITEEGREFLSQAQQISDGDSGDMDDLLPIFAKRQFEKDVITLSTAAAASAPLSLLFIDLDHFKSVNDSFNHLVGNEVLVEVAKTLKAAWDRKGRCYRWGGEELAVLLPNFCLGEAQALAERVRDAISRTEFKSYPHRMTASIGVSTCPETSHMDNLVKDADSATSEAKEGGRDQVHLAQRPSEKPAAPSMAGSRLSAKDITKRIDAARIIPTVEHGVASNFIIDVLNDSDDEITVKEVQLLSKDDIRLTNPMRQTDENLWRFPPKAKLPIAWRAQPDPAGALVNMNSHRGALFETEMKILFSIEVLGRSRQCESKVYVRVDALQSKIIQLAG
jgi:diguanylate cyclase (GGDEF)-like protein